MEAIITIPPYAPYIAKVTKHPIVTGVRLNTVMQLRESESLEGLLGRIQKEIGGKDLWIDLKTRQIRVTNYASTPYHYLEISHNIKVRAPVKAYFNDGLEEATVAVAEGKKLIMLDGPERVVGPGESVNILDPTLEIDGFLTETDQKYIEAAKKLGIHTYMASYFEQENDITDILKLDPEAKILAKIESRKGLDFVDKVYPRYKDHIHLMAARGDLYVEVGKPHKILRAVKKIVRADENAVVASRIFPSFRKSPVPSSQDISDIGYLLEVGYKKFMIGDDICFHEESLTSALNLLDAIVHDYR